MKFTKLLTVGVLTAIMTTTSFVYAEAIDATEKKEMEKVIHDYLIAHPEVLLEASQVLQQKQQQAMQQQAQTAIKDNAEELFKDNFTVIGNPKGEITLVEFFDYQCIHCKKMAPVISELTKQDNRLKVVFKEFPIFGKSSDLASRVALAAAMQGKYQAMHEALIKQSKRLDENLIMNTAKSIGLNMTKLKVDMDSKAVKDALDANRQLAEKLRLMGTPAFIIASTQGDKLKEGSEPAFIPGAATKQSLQELIKKAASN